MMCKVYVLLKHLSIQFMLSVIGSQCLFPLLKMKRFPINESSESEISVMVQLSITQFWMISSKISWMLLFHAQELIIFFSIDSYNLIMGMTNPIPHIHFKILIWGTISKTCSINTDWLYSLQRKIWPIKENDFNWWQWAPYKGIKKIRKE